MSATIYEYEELAAATDDFAADWLLGEGSGGARVYGAVLEGCAVAIKVLPPEAARLILLGGTSAT